MGGLGAAAGLFVLAGSAVADPTGTTVTISDCSAPSQLEGAMSTAVTVAITFSCSGTITLGAPLVVPSGHTVSLSGAGQNVVLSGGNATSMIVDNGNLTLAHRQDGRTRRQRHRAVRGGHRHRHRHRGDP